MKELIELIKYLFGYIPDWSKILVLISVFAIVIIRYIVKLENFILFLKKIFGKKPKEKKHGIFEYIDTILKFKLYSIDFGNKRKNKLFREFFKIPLESLLYHIIIIDETKNLNELDNDEFRKLVMNHLHEHMKETTMKIKDEFGEEIKDVIMNANWMSDLNQMTLDYITHELQNRSESDTNNIVLGRIFAIMSFSIKIIFETSAPRYQKLNGTLDELLNKRYGKKI